MILKVIDVEAGASPSLVQTEGMTLGAYRVRGPVTGAALTSEVESDRKRSQEMRAIEKDGGGALESRRDIA